MPARSISAGKPTAIGTLRASPRCGSLERRSAAGQSTACRHGPPRTAVANAMQPTNGQTKFEASLFQVCWNLGVVEKSPQSGTNPGDVQSAIFLPAILSSQTSHHAVADGRAGRCNELKVRSLNNSTAIRDDQQIPHRVNSPSQPAAYATGARRSGRREPRPNVSCPGHSESPLRNSCRPHRTPARCLSGESPADELGHRADVPHPPGRLAVRLDRQSARTRAARLSLGIWNLRLSRLGIWTTRIRFRAGNDGRMTLGL